MPDSADGDTGDTMPELLGESLSNRGDRLSLLGLRLGGRELSSDALQHRPHMGPEIWGNGWRGDGVLCLANSQWPE